MHIDVEEYITRQGALGRLSPRARPRLCMSLVGGFFMVCIPVACVREDTLTRTCKQVIGESFQVCEVHQGSPFLESLFLGSECARLTLP